jgi:hypothetical protein
MKSKKSIILIVTLIIVTVGVINFIGVGNNKMNKIYNDNSIIADKADCWGIDESEQTAELGMYKGKLKLSGCGTIWKYESSEEFDLKVPYTLLVKSQKAKIVLVSPDNTVTTLIENTNKSTVNGSTTITVPIKKGINRIKLVGYKKSEIEVELHIDKGTFEKINL